MSGPVSSPPFDLITDPSAPFPGGRFVGATWRKDVPPALIARLRAATVGWTATEGTGWYLASERAGSFATAGDLSVAVGHPRVFDRDTASLLDATGLAERLHREGSAALDGIAPAFRAAWAHSKRGTVHGRTDAFGIGHLFTASADGVAAIASSGTLLADIFCAPASVEALAAFAVFGTFLGEETPFAGVGRAPAGTEVELNAGRLVISGRTTGALEVKDPAEALRGAVEAMLKAAPEAELELSGGLDSRLILAAMPQSQRVGRSTITIGVAGEPSDDMTVAEAIAGTEHLAWEALDAGRLALLDAGGLQGLLSRAVAGYDHMANPLDKAALITAGAGRSVQARFGGQNGEILRGFYYPGQPLGAAPSEALARRLISWRLEVNDRVNDGILSPAAREGLRAAAEERSLKQLLSFGGNWGETLDRFYLSQRMQVWVGNGAGNRLMDYQPLFPFFDRAFVAAAMATPSAEKLNSRAAYRLLVQLDPALARRPLADGLTPATVPSNAILRRFQDIGLDASRVTKRLRRRMMGGTRATLGSQSAAQHWHRLELFRSLPFDQLAKTGLFNDEGLERLSSGKWLPDRPTLGFVLMVAGLETRP